MSSRTIQKVGGVERSFTDLSVKNVVGRFANQNAGTITFTVSEAIDSTPVFAYDDEIIIWYNRTGSGTSWSGGTIWFRGFIGVCEQAGSESSEARFYVAKDAWQALEETLYGQMWVPSGSLNTSHVFINRGMTMKQQIQNVLTLADTAGIAIADGTIDELGTIFMTEVRDAMMGEIIRQQLRMAPDTVTWMDYSTTPPELNVRRWTNLSAIDLPMTKPLKRPTLRARHDLVLPCVILFFEKTSDTDGRTTLNVTHQTAPAAATGFERGALVCTIDLKGPSVTTDEANIIAEPISANSATDDIRLEWWKQRFPHYRHARINSLVIAAADVKFYTTGVEPGTIAYCYTVGVGWEVTVGGGVVSPVPVNLGDYVKRIDGGNVQIWQATKNDTALSTGPETSGNSDLFTYINTVRAEIDWDTYAYKSALSQESGPLTRWLETEQGFRGEEIEVQALVTVAVYESDKWNSYSEYQTVKLMATNAVTGLYSTVTSTTAGEDEPALLADYLYSVGSILHYEGTLILSERECSHTYKMGQRINLPGGTGAYAAINALVQSVTEDLDNGITQITVGPPSHLGPSDLIEWVQAFRRRKVWTNPATQDSEDVAGAANGDVGRKGPSHDSTSGAGLHDRIKLVGAGGSIDINSADTNGKALTIREMDYCDAGTVKKIMVLACAPYVP